MSVEVRIIERALREELAKSPKMQAAMDDVARKVTARIATIAKKDTGHFRDESLQGKRSRLKRTIYSTDVAGHIIEWGSAKQSPQAPFRRAVRSLGLPLKQSAKP